MAINIYGAWWRGGEHLVLKAKPGWLERSGEADDEEAVDRAKVWADCAVQLLQRALRGVPSEPCGKHRRLHHRRVPWVYRWRGGGHWPRSQVRGLWLPPQLPPQGAGVWGCMGLRIRHIVDRVGMCCKLGVLLLFCNGKCPTIRPLPMCLWRQAAWCLSRTLVILCNLELKFIYLFFHSEPLCGTWFHEICVLSPLWGSTVTIVSFLATAVCEWMQFSSLSCLCQLVYLK